MAKNEPPTHGPKVVTFKCAVPSCPGHVTYKPQNLPAIVGVAPMYAGDEDIVYLQCDAPEHHWMPYHINP